MIVLGIDLGSSSVKASLLETDTGHILGSGQHPDSEMKIDAPRPGWAEQDPAAWEASARAAVAQAIHAAGVSGRDIQAIGIAYQMHGLVCLDADDRPLRPAIIWCDSRAVDLGDQAFKAIGSSRCLKHLLNSPGNFTASKLAWVREHEPEVFGKISKICLPGEYLASRLTGRVATTVSGLSEGIFWDFDQKQTAGFLLEHYGIDADCLPPVVPTFGNQGQVTAEAADTFGLKAGTPVTYRAGDQPNNALSLNVLKAGEVAATAGTSGVVYGVSDTIRYDPASRINTFAHVNYQKDDPKLGLLLCVNGTGIALAWARRMLDDDLTYPQLNETAQSVDVGSDGLLVLPFGNGAERMLGNREVGAHLGHIDFNRHGPAHIARAVQEGIACAFAHGMQVLRETGVDLRVIRAGRANLFLSPLFRQTLADLTGVGIELYDTDGAAGAARGAALGADFYAGPAEAFADLQKAGITQPSADQENGTRELYERWSSYLARMTSSDV